MAFWTACNHKFSGTLACLSLIFGPLHQLMTAFAKPGSSRLGGPGVCNKIHRLRLGSGSAHIRTLQYSTTTGPILGNSPRRKIRQKKEGGRS